MAGLCSRLFLYRKWLSWFQDFYLLVEFSEPGRNLLGDKIGKGEVTESTNLQMRKIKKIQQTFVDILTARSATSCKTNRNVVWNLETKKKKNRKKKKIYIKQYIQEFRNSLVEEVSAPTPIAKEWLVKHNNKPRKTLSGSQDVHILEKKRRQMMKESSS